MPEKKLKLFELMKEEHVDWLMEHCEVRKFKEDSVVVQEGTPGDGIYIVLKGNLKIIINDNGVENTVNTIGEGEVFGEISFLTKTPITATVKAINESTILSVKLEKLNGAVQGNKELALDLYSSLSSLLSEKLKQMSVIVSSGVGIQYNKAENVLPKNIKELIVELKELICNTAETESDDEEAEKIQNIQSEYNRLFTEIFDLSEKHILEYSKLSEVKLKDYLHYLKLELLPCLLDSSLYEHILKTHTQNHEDFSTLEMLYHSDDSHQHHVQDYLNHALTHLTHFSAMKKSASLMKDLLSEMLKLGDKHIVSIFNSPCYELLSLDKDTLSHGLNKVTFVENDIASLDKIKNDFNLENNNNVSYINLVKEFSGSIRSSTKQIEKADVIYMLYHANHLDDGELLQELNSYYDLLSDEGILIFGTMDFEKSKNNNTIREMFMSNVNTRKENDFLKVINTSKFKGKLVDFNKDEESGAILCACVKAAA